MARARVMVAAALLCCAVPRFASAAAMSWPMFRHDAQHTGRSPYNGPLAGMLAWSYDTGGAVWSSPAIGFSGVAAVGLLAYAIKWGMGLT